jgi:nucleoid-associated protein YgaU
LALIIKLVLEEMQKNQKNQVVTKNVKKSEDSELLKSLQNSQVDTTKEIEKKPKVIEKKKLEKLANKKIKDEIIKKKITYNAVVINHKEVKSVDDLARLYASINKISKKKKKKILKSAYTKKITKEIVIRKNAMRTITVRAGDTLSSIAQRAYGKSSMYKKIFEANPDLLSDPNNLRVGMKLRVPK